MAKQKIYEGDYILYRKGGRGEVFPGEYQWPEEGGHLVRIGDFAAYGDEPDLEMAALSEIVGVPISKIREVEALTPAERKAWFDYAQGKSKTKPKAAKPARKKPVKKFVEPKYLNFPGQETTKAAKPARKKPMAKKKDREGLFDPKHYWARRVKRKYKYSRGGSGQYPMDIGDDEWALDDTWYDGTVYGNAVYETESASYFKPDAPEGGDITIIHSSGPKGQSWRISGHERKYRSVAALVKALEGDAFWFESRRKAASKRKAPVKRKAPAKRKTTSKGQWSARKEGRTYSVYEGSRLHKAGLSMAEAKAVVQAYRLLQ